MSMVEMRVFVGSSEQDTAADRMIGSATGELVASREVPERIACLADGLARCGYIALDDHGSSQDDMAELEELLLQLHSSDYIAFLMKESHPEHAEITEEGCQYAAPGVEQDTPVDKTSFARAKAAALTAVTAARAMATQQAHYAYALCRPPGHHAGRSFFGGYCFLNNAALAALSLRKNGLTPVAVIDIDYHVGNGSSDCLAAYPDIGFASCHASTEKAFTYQPELPPAAPHHLYRPFVTSPTAAEYVSTVKELVEHACSAGAAALVLSLGYDIIEGDPHGTWSLNPSVFSDIGRVFRASGLPVCVVQEGGYRLDRLADCANFFVTALVAPPIH
jgi:acetoin utilization deacetylase AcuC-like enzyme